MNRHKLDNRIRTLIETGVACGHRSMFAVVGSKARDQVVVLHHILSKATVSARPSVLWCYKKDLGFSSHRKKRMKEIKHQLSVSKINIREEDSFDVFIASTQIRYCYYSETQNILGNTYGMLVLQDFEALTPNTLARTVETVEGGGLVVFLLQSVNSLRQLYTLTMDVHNRYRTEAHTEIVARFNERFILSLGSCKACAVLDDQLNVLPISSHIAKLPTAPAKSEQSASQKELSELKLSLRDTKPIGDLIANCLTACQAKCFLRLLDTITEKSLNETCSITAARGRGKSAALGLALAGAVAFGYSNIFVTSPSPENLKTLFQFILKGFDTLQYEEHTDYELVRSTNAEFNKALVRINVNRQHRQTIQYIHPSDAVKLGQAELVVVDEAAAIPLPLVKQLISGPYLVFLASTINGYEGTGRSLSLKLLHELRKQSIGFSKGEKALVSKGRKLHEITLEESIRYKAGDPIESWLNRLLCLDATIAAGRLTSGTPPPVDCQLYYVNRDTLFSFHRSSEVFLQQLVSIYVSAHYKNQPNDLQMLSDAPAHHIFALLPPVKLEQTSLPQVLVVVQVCLEGSLSSESVKDGLGKGRRSAGDLLPWTISQQFQDTDFPTLSGARIVRVAVHPDYQSMGYGARALEFLKEYYEGRVTCVDESVQPEKQVAPSLSDENRVELLEEQLQPRLHLPPLLQRLSERPPERLHYIGVSYGLTLPLLKFWKKVGFVPVYVKQTPSDLTGEHTTIMIKALEQEETSGNEMVAAYFCEFRRRFLSLLAFEFSSFPTQIPLSILQLRNKEVEELLQNKVLSRSELSVFLTNQDLRRLSQYARNLVEHRLVTDLLPDLAKLFIGGRLSASLSLSPVQAALLIACGLQHKKVEALAAELDMPVSQVLSLYNKTMRKLSEHLDSVCVEEVRAEMEEEEAERERLKQQSGKPTSNMQPLQQTLMDDLEEGAEEIRKRQERDKKKMKEEIARGLDQYAIKGDDSEWSAALGEGMKEGKKLGLLSVKNKRKIEQMEVPEVKDKKANRKKKKLGFNSRD